MNRMRCLYAFAVSLVLVGCQTTRPTSIDDVSTHEGLVRVEVKGMDAVYRRPDVNLSGYDRILLRPVSVSFAQNWKPERDTGSALYRMTPADREKIKKDLAAEFERVFRHVLQEQGGYRLVSEPAADVLEVQASIVDLYVTAPDVSMQDPGITRVYTADCGEMTLASELHDSVTGQVLARACDRREDRRDTWQWTTSVPTPRTPGVSFASGPSD